MTAAGLPFPSHHVVEFAAKKMKQSSFINFEYNFYKISQFIYCIMKLVSHISRVLLSFFRQRDRSTTRNVDLFKINEYSNVSIHFPSIYSIYITYLFLVHISYLDDSFIVMCGDSQEFSHFGRCGHRQNACIWFSAVNFFQCTEHVTNSQLFTKKKYGIDVLMHKLKVSHIKLERQS